MSTILVNNISPYSGATVNLNGALSATTYYNLPLDIRVTGGTYSNGTASFTNNTGGTFSVTGLTTLFTGGTVSGSTVFTNGLTATTISASTYLNTPYWVSGSTGSYSIKAKNNSSIDATGNYSLAEGSGTTASGIASHAEGGQTTASGNYSHAEGFLTIASGQKSHAGGSGSTATGDYSFVHGSGSTATGFGTIVLGNGISGASYNTVYVPDLVIKKYNAVPTTSADSIGENGSITWDNNYFYWKANGQWLRISGSTF
jgi:hypothetical protein